MLALVLMPQVNFGGTDKKIAKIQPDEGCSANIEKNSTILSINGMRVGEHERFLTLSAVSKFVITHQGELDLEMISLKNYEFGPDV